MSNMLANISSEKAFSLSNLAASNPLLLESGTLAQLQQSSSITDQQSVALFSDLLSRVDSSQLQLKQLNSCKNNTTRNPTVEKTPRVV